MKDEWQVMEMLVYLAAGAAAFFYLTMLPVRTGLAWKSGRPVRIGITIGPFRFSAHGGVKYEEGTGLVASLTHDRSGRKRELRFHRRIKDSAALADRLAALSDALRYLLGHITPWRLRAHCHLSFSDAARTAFLFGLLQSALSTLHALRPSLPLDASVSADFRSMQTRLDFCGILSCRLGHIMAAALIGCREYLARRLHTWITSSRSKAS